MPLVSMRQRLDETAARRRGFGRAGHASNYRPLSLEEMRNSCAAAAVAA